MKSYAKLLSFPSFSLKLFIGSLKLYNLINKSDFFQFAGDIIGMEGD